MEESFRDLTYTGQKANKHKASSYLSNLESDPSLVKFKEKTVTNTDFLFELNETSNYENDLVNILLKAIFAIKEEIIEEFIKKFDVHKIYSQTIKNSCKKIEKSIKNFRTTAKKIEKLNIIQKMNNFQKLKLVFVEKQNHYLKNELDNMNFHFQSKINIKDEEINKIKAGLLFKDNQINLKNNRDDHNHLLKSANSFLPETKTNAINNRINEKNLTPPNVFRTEPKEHSPFIIKTMNRYQPIKEKKDKSFETKIKLDLSKIAKKK